MARLYYFFDEFGSLLDEVTFGTEEEAWDYANAINAFSFGCEP